MALSAIILDTFFPQDLFTCANTKLSAMNGFLGDILQFVADIDPVLRTFVAGLAVMLETSIFVGLLVPGDTVVLVSATGVTNSLEYFSLVFAVIAGALVGESIGFGIGRYFGPKVRGGWLGRKLGPDRIARADRFVKRRGGIAVFISRFLPVFHSVIPFTAGMSPMPYRTFMAWTAPACTLWGFLYTSLGSGAAETYRELQGQFEWAAWLFVGVILLGIVVVWLAKKILMRFAHSESEETGPITLPKPETDHSAS